MQAIRHARSVVNRCYSLARQPQQLKRYSSEGIRPIPPLCTELTHRGLIRVEGEDAAVFLQGLITNDVRCLDHGCPTLYAMMLNVQGRILYDLILYNMGESSISHKQSFFIECDAALKDDFLSLMKRYRIRKKVDLSDISDEFALWAVLPPSEDSAINSCDLVMSHPEKVSVCSSDPRLTSFGCRMILPAGEPGLNMFHHGTKPITLDDYHRRRFSFGIGEGPADFPPGNSFPLEGNAVFLNGVSFNKGCYIGQELTARTHHTGVIRKRLLPITFSSVNHGALPGDSMENFAGKSCGKFRDSVGEKGLALLRVTDSIGKGPLVVKHNSESICEAETHIPKWWPQDYTTDEIPGYKMAS